MEETPKTELTDGQPVPADNSHTKLKENGQQEGYVVLAPEERSKGFVRPYRDTYLHKQCGATTTMSKEIAETYARDPQFYGGTFCCGCRQHFSLEQFVWDGTDIQVGT